MTKLEKWGIAAGSVLSIGAILGFLINLTSTMALSLDKQARDSELLHARTPLITEVLDAQRLIMQDLNALNRTHIGYVYLNSDHMIVTADGTAVKVQLHKDTIHERSN